ncbi:MAG: D-2-hydroxyacid dehydrogenase [Chloroflexi bacterium]|nr:D-2-hydroxyacid dehydrogenase [Chloroflexota bacterium]
MERIKVLMTLRFNETQINRLRAVSPNLELVQRSLPEGADTKDTTSLFDGDEEIFYGTVPPRDLARAPRLRWAQLHTAGINHLAAHPILQSDVRLTTSSGVHAVPIGEMTIAMMLALARKLPTMVRKQDQAEWSPHKWRLYLGTELHGKTLGVVGYGSIGRHVARIAKLGFGMRVLALSRSGTRVDRGYVEPGTGDPDGSFPDAWFTLAQLRDLLAQSDFVLIATPLTPDTRDLIGDAELGAMKSSAFILNIARGGVVDEAALLRALNENRIAGAGLDVFEKEPLPADHALWRAPNVLLSPHVSAATPHYDDRAVALFAENLRRYLNGAELLNLINKEKGY